MECNTLQRAVVCITVVTYSCFSKCKLSSSAFYEELKELINHQGAVLLCMGSNSYEWEGTSSLCWEPTHCKSSLAENNLGVLLDNTGNMGQKGALAARKADKILGCRKLREELISGDKYLNHRIIWVRKCL